MVVEHSSHRPVPLIRREAHAPPAPVPECAFSPKEHGHLTKLSTTTGHTPQKGPRVNDNHTDAAELSAKRLPELQAIATSMGIRGVRKLRKGELIEAIRTGKAPKRRAPPTTRPRLPLLRALRRHRSPRAPATATRIRSAAMHRTATPSPPVIPTNAQSVAAASARVGSKTSSFPIQKPRAIAAKGSAPTAASAATIKGATPSRATRRTAMAKAAATVATIAPATTTTTTTTIAVAAARADETATATATVATTTITASRRSTKTTSSSRSRAFSTFATTTRLCARPATCPARATSTCR